MKISTANAEDGNGTKYFKYTVQAYSYSKKEWKNGQECTRTYNVSAQTVCTSGGSSDCTPSGGNRTSNLVC